MYFFSNLELFHCSMFGSNCCFLTCMQIPQEAGKVVWYSHLFRNFQFVLIRTVNGFHIVTETEVVPPNPHPLEFYFLYDQMDVDNLISGSSTFSKSSLNIWHFSFHILFKQSWRIFSITLLVWNECSCAFFHIAFLSNWNESWPFPVLCPLLSFPTLMAYWVQHLKWNPITSTCFVCSDAS